MLSAPYLNGKIAETQTLKWVDVINREPQLYGDLSVLSYHYGFASTRAKYAYTPPLLWAKILQSNNIIEFSCVSQHGGWGVDFTCQLGRARAYTEFVEQQLAGVDPFEVEDQNGRLSLGKISFIGNVQEIADVFVVGDFELNLATLSLSSANTEVALTVL